MQIEISDEQIQNIVGNVIKTRVDEWFRDAKNKYIIREMVASCISEKFGTSEYSQLIKEEAINGAKNLCTKDVVKKICDRVSYDIAEAYAEKYGD